MYPKNPIFPSKMASFSGPNKTPLRFIQVHENPSIGPGPTGDSYGTYDTNKTLLWKGTNPVDLNIPRRAVSKNQVAFGTP